MFFSTKFWIRKHLDMYSFVYSFLNLLNINGNFRSQIEAMMSDPIKRSLWCLYNFAYEKKD